MSQVGEAPRALVLDASVVVAWVLEQKINGRWARANRVLANPPAELVLPASALTEVLYVVRAGGNDAGFAQVHATLTGFGIRIEPCLEADAIWAADRIAESQVHPAIWTNSRGRQRGTLSLGDGLVLAVAHRLSTFALTFDEAWMNFPTMQLPAVNLMSLPEQ